MRYKEIILKGILLSLITAGSILLLNFYLLDGIVGCFVSSFFKEDTLYAPGYSDAAFRRISKGMARQKVFDVLGSPLGEAWSYGDSPWIFFEEGKVTKTSNVFPEKSVNKQNYSEALFKQIKKNMTREEVLHVLGPPLTESWIYSTSPGDMSYRMRTITFVDEKVKDICHEFYID
jgi:outer membrane protein assembly factor BamE (lipoprotein component of BamABCDE complex)